MAEKFILINEELTEKILTEIAELKRLLLLGNGSNKKNIDGELMDTVDLMHYLKLNRRTIYNYRIKKGMPFERKDNGRIFYWKSAIDNYFGKK